LITGYDSGHGGAGSIPGDDISVYLFDKDGRVKVVGLVAPKDFSRRPCRSSGQRFARVLSRRRRCGSRFFFGRDAFPCHGVLHPNRGQQASPCFLTRRVRRRLSPTRVAFSRLRGSFSCFLVFYMLDLCTMKCFLLPCLGFRDPLVTIALLLPLFFPCPRLFTLT
jgi:hypothetical protein